MSTRTFAGRDLEIGADGNLLIVTGLQAVLYDAERAARTVRGELVFAVDEGIPYFQVVWVGTPNVVQFEAALRARLRKVPDVSDVLALSTRQDRDTLAYEATIRTPYGTGVIDG